MIKLTVPLEAPPEVAALLFQAARDGLIVSDKDAASVWKELVSVAAMHCPENLERANAKLRAAQAERSKGDESGQAGS